MDKFRRPEKTVKILDRKMTVLTNRATKDYMQTLSLTLEQKKEIASLFAELQHTVTPNEGSGGEIFVSKAEAQSAQDELAKVAEDWGIRKSMLSGRSAAGTTAMLELICLAKVISSDDQ